MRFSFVSGVRNDLLQLMADRLATIITQTVDDQNRLNRLPIDFNYNNTLAPHVLQNRLLYTVPAGRRATVSGINMSMEVVSVAAPVGNILMSLSVVPAAAGAVKIMERNTSKNTQYDSIEWSINSEIYLGPGDALNLDTLNTSTGGTILHSITGIVNEYDL